MTVLDERIVVPWEVGKAARRSLRHFPCLLCDATLAGARAVASTIDPEALAADGPSRPLWVVHHGCYVNAFRHALRSVPVLLTAPSEDAAHELFRQALNTKAAEPAA